MIATVDLVRDLAVAPIGEPVLSLHLRTDPRDPANTNHVPGWLIALRNGLRTVTDHVERTATREERIALRDLLPRVEKAIVELTPAERGRGISYFIGADGSGELLLGHQLAPRDDVVRWDIRPFISPLVDIASRGRSTGLVLVGADKVRLLHWQAGRVEEPGRSVYELELGDWREYAGYAAANPARGQQTATHSESFEQRVGDWRRRFRDDVAVKVSQRTSKLGWQRLLVAGEQPLPEGFVDALGADATRRVVGQVDVNVLSQQPAEIATRLEADLEEAHRREAHAVLSRAQAAAGGGLGALGPDEVFQALAEHRVDHLVLDPAARLVPGPFGAAAEQALEGAGHELLAERAVELAVAGGADVTTMAADDAPELQEASNIAALLRF